MFLDIVKLERAVTFIKHIASVVPLIFPPKTFTWNKMVLPAPNSLKDLELVENELERFFPKVFKKIPFCIWFIETYSKCFRKQELKNQRTLQKSSSVCPLPITSHQPANFGKNGSWPANPWKGLKVESTLRI